MLVKRFSWELETTVPSENVSEEFCQVRTDLINEAQRDRDRELRRRDERRRINEHFELTRFVMAFKLAPRRA